MNKCAVQLQIYVHQQEKHGFIFQLSYSKNATGMKKASKKGHFAHIGNEIKICSQNKCHHHLSNVCENSFRMFHSNWSFLITIHLFGSLLDSAKEIQTAKQMNGNQKWPSYCETYEMNFHRRWKGDDGIYFGYRFWFHCLNEKNGLFLEAFFTPMAFLEYDFNDFCCSVWYIALL